MQRLSFIYFIIAMALVALTSSVLKMIALKLDPYIIMGYRTMISTMIVLSLVFIFRNKIPLKAPRVDNFIKSGLGLVWMPLWAVSIASMPIATVVSLTFITPLIVVLLSSVMFFERINKKIIGAILLGMLGGIVICKPIFSIFSYHILCVFVVCFCWSLVSIYTKKLTNQHQHPIHIVLYTNAMQAMLCMPYIVVTDINLSNQHLLHLLLLSVLCISSAIFTALSYQHAKLSKLIGLDYLRLIFASIFAFILFGEVPTINTIIGSMIIFIASTIVIKSHKTH